MSRTRIALILLVIAILVSAWWIRRKSTSPPDVPFAKVRRETLVSTLATNGKVEPSEWVAVRAERAGTVSRVEVQKGQQVAKGSLLVELDARDARAEVSSGEAAVAQARAELQTIDQGGRSSAHVEIDSALERDQIELKAAQRDHELLRRLAEKQAATRQEVIDANHKVQQLQADIQALARKRAALVSPADRTAAEAKLREALAGLEQAQARLERSRLLAPIAGVVYDLPARVGAYLNPGDLAAHVGDLKTLRVRVYVDEPELGRVARGMPVTITWDAMPGRHWSGAVDKMPTQIIALGTRQVGEVICVIQNPDLLLLPATNINAEIVSQVVENGLVIPKEAIRKENNQVGVYALRGESVEWRPIQLGASSVTRAAVLEGLVEGDLIALASEAPLHSGARVQVVER
ncbi:MAG: efflux RND transporter periplasmic adaptor subunit [Bryobacteraceae bacterium]|jgi:multidrug resistance efflux pump